jgi:two-component system nitrate/nitrite sensor histidine kinase NarX
MLFLIREAASNVARHAAATHVWISMARRRDSVIVKVEDDGRGFVDAVERHHGLRNMAERARLIGGRLDVDSRPGAGTSVTLTLPMHTD